MALTFFTTNQLLKLGFHFPDYEHLCEEGMTYWYNETEYVIGGGDGQPYTAFDHELAEKGTWLPDAEQLMEWLQRNDFDVIIHWNDAMQWFDVHATDMQARVRFDAGGGDLCNSLGKLIQKICKANYRDLTPRPVECLEIISEDTEAVSLSDLIQTILFDGGISAAQNKSLKEDPDYLEGCTDTNIPESDLCELVLLAQRDKNTARYLPNIVDSVDDAAITRRVFELLFHFPQTHIRDSLLVSLSHKTLDIASLAELCETNTCFECYFTWIMELYRDPCATCEELNCAIDRFLACPFSHMAKEVYQETRELDKDYEVGAEKQAALERLLAAAK